MEPLSTLQVDYGCPPPSGEGGLSVLYTRLSPYRRQGGADIPPASEFDRQEITSPPLNSVSGTGMLPLVGGA